MTPDCIRLALTLAGEVAACTVVLPRIVQGPRGPVGGAVITLVACQPALQGQGYGGASVRDALAYMATQGMALGILYGHPAYYPRFGFAPVLSAVRTHLTVAGEVPNEQALRPATDEDVPLLTSLYTEQLGHYPCTVERGPEPWLWRVRNPEHCALLRLDSSPAYAVVAENREQDLLFVHEAAAAGAEANRRLLAGLVAEARQRGLKEVRLGTPADHALTRLARQMGAEQRLHPAKAGMAVVVDWAPLLPPGFTVEGEELHCHSHVALRIAQLPLTQLVLGYRSAEDLLLSGEATLVGHEEELRQAFPARAPHWFLAPFWH